VIPITRAELDSELSSKLDTLTVRLGNAPKLPGARAAWKHAQPEKQKLRSILSQMAAGIQRCMYCGDNLGTDIDHFEPIALRPARTFDWFNHLLACSHCNSNYKRDRFPRDVGGRPLLIDPSREDPGRHVTLTLITGEFRPLTPQGQATIDVFGLNRADLARGRAGAFLTRRAILCHAHNLLRIDRLDDAERCLRALAEEPHASVLHAMLRLIHLPGATDVLGADVVAALQDSKLRLLLGL
jgi:uncharacterized protein (TIGR02646 family)